MALTDPSTASLIVERKAFQVSEKLAIFNSKKRQKVFAINVTKI